MAITTPLRMAARLTATMARSGLRGACSSEPVHGFTAPPTFMAMSITACIPIMDTRGQHQPAARNLNLPSIWIESPTSKEMKCGMGAATSVEGNDKNRRNESPLFKSAFGHRPPFLNTDLVDQLFNSSEERLAR